MLSSCMNVTKPGKIKKVLDCGIITTGLEFDEKY